MITGHDDQTLAPDQMETVVADTSSSARTTHPLAIAAVACGGVGLLVLPILLGPAALIMGAIAEHQTRAQERPGKVLAGIGALLGLIEVLMVMGAFNGMA